MTEREDLSRIMGEAWPVTPVDQQRAALAHTARLLDAGATFWRRVLQ